MNFESKSLSRKIGPYCSKVLGSPWVLYSSWNSNSPQVRLALLSTSEPTQTPQKQIRIVTLVPPWECTVKPTERKIINMSYSKHTL